MSALWLSVLLFTLVVWDCIYDFIGDPVGVCDEVARLAIPVPHTVGPVLAGVSALGLIAVWVPALRRRRNRHRYKPERALLENIGRLREPYGDLVDVDAEVDAVIAELWRRVEVVETAFATDSTATRSMTSQWMRLLIDANRLHNEGSLPTDEFKSLNTRLLQVVTVASR